MDELARLIALFVNTTLNMKKAMKFVAFFQHNKRQRYFIFTGYHLKKVKILLLDTCTSR